MGELWGQSKTMFDKISEETLKHSIETFLADPGVIGNHSQTFFAYSVTPCDEGGEVGGSGVITDVMPKPFSN